MSILTKVFIVVMVVLAIVSSIVFIQKANTEVNYKMANEALQQQLGLYGANLAASELAKEDQKRRNLEIQASTGEMVRSSEAMMAQKQQALGQALGQIASKDTTIASLQASNTALTEAVKQQVVRNNQLSEQLANRLQVVQKQNDLLQQDKRTINELTRDLTHAKEAARVKHVLLASAEEKIKELEDKLRMGGFEVSETSDQVASAQGAAIDGSVLAVIADQNVAQLNVGLASGVTEGMRFILYRGDQLVGTMIVATVDANTSAGSLSDLQLTPIQGDKATTSLTSRKGANP